MPLDPLLGPLWGLVAPRCQPVPLALATPGRTPHWCSGDTQLGPRPLGPEVQCHAALILVPCGKGARRAGAGTVPPAPGVVSSHCVPKASRAGTGPWHWGEPSPVGAAGFTPFACTSLRMLQGCCCLCPPLGSSSPRSPHRTKGSATPGPLLLGPLLGRGTPGAAPSTLSCSRPLFARGFWGHLATLPGGHLPPRPSWSSCRSPLVLSRPARLASPPRCLPAAAPAPLGAHFSVCPTASPPRTGLSPSPRWLGR